MAKVIAYTALLYGAPYLGAAIQSVIDAVDRYVVLYSPTPSHNGGVAQLPNPDTKERLFSIAHTIAGNKLVWIEGNWKYENQHRGAIWDYEPNADVVLVLDSDECWSELAVSAAVEQRHYGGQVRLPVLEYWRSFYRAFPDKLVWPTRIIYPAIAQQSYAEASPDTLIHHFGYAQPVKYVAFKWSGIHGHQSQLRTDCDWVNDVYATNRQVDCHPTTPNHWNAQQIDPFAMGLPGFMKYHPNANVEVIE